MGYRPGASDVVYPGTTVVDHAWWDPTEFADVGTITAERIEELYDDALAAYRNSVVPTSK